MEVRVVGQIGIHRGERDLWYSSRLLRVDRLALFDFFLSRDLLLGRLLVLISLWSVHHLLLALVLLLMLRRWLLLMCSGRLLFGLVRLLGGASWIVCLSVLLSHRLVLSFFRSDKLLARAPLCESLDQTMVLVLPELRFELLGDVEQMSWLHDSTSVGFTVPVDVGSLQELLVEEYNDLLLGLAYNRSADTEGYICSAAGVQVHHSLTNFEHFRSVSAVQWAPVWESFSVENLRRHVLVCLDLQLHVRVLGLNLLALLV